MLKAKFWCAASHSTLLSTKKRFPVCIFQKRQKSLCYSQLLSYRQYSEYLQSLTANKLRRTLFLFSTTQDTLREECVSLSNGTTGSKTSYPTAFCCTFSFAAVFYLQCANMENSTHTYYTLVTHLRIRFTDFIIYWAQQCFSFMSLYPSETGRWLHFTISCLVNISVLTSVIMVYIQICCLYFSLTSIITVGTRFPDLRALRYKCSLFLLLSGDINFC